MIPVGVLSMAVASATLTWLAAAYTRGGRAGLALLSVWTAALLVSGVFPTDPPGQWDEPPTMPGALHGIGGLLAFTALPAAAVALSRVWRRDPRWAPVAGALAVTTRPTAGRSGRGGRVHGPGLDSGERVTVAISVLLADDQHLVRAGFRSLLKRDRDIVVLGEASTGDEAVRTARALRPDVVLMDIRMPGLDGITARGRHRRDAARRAHGPRTGDHPAAGERHVQ